MSHDGPHQPGALNDPRPPPSANLDAANNPTAVYFVTSEEAMVYGVGATAAEAHAAAGATYDANAATMGEDSEIDRIDKANMIEGRDAFMASTVALRVEIPAGVGPHRACRLLGFGLHSGQMERLASLLPTTDAPRAPCVCEPAPVPEVVAQPADPYMKVRALTALEVLYVADEHVQAVADFIAPLAKSPTRQAELDSRAVAA